MYKPIKVLVIDNSSTVQTLINGLHEHSEVKVTLLESGLTGLKLAETELFDLVCIADHTPDVSIDYFCCQLRNLSGYEHAALILFATVANSATLKEALLVGATDVVDKTDIAQLKHYLERYIERLTCHVRGKVLLVENSLSQQTVLQKLLVQIGLDVEVCASAKEALTKLRQSKNYDLVLTDTILDGEMSGIALVRAMRRTLNEVLETPVLAMSVFDEKSRRIELLHLGVNDYLLKPVIQEELQARVINLIEKRRLLAEILAQRTMLEQMALIDPVTKLYNRNAFNDIGPKQLESAIRNRTPLCLVVADIDYFKQVNDTYGHIKGDAVLTEMGECMKTYVRRGDLVFRWGGEEFVLLLECNAQTGAVLVEKIRYKIEHTPFAQLAITASFGISSLETGKQTNLQQLFEQADQALAQAKNRGRNRVYVYAEH